MTFQPFPAERRREKGIPGRFAGMLLRMIVRQEGEIICKDWPLRQAQGRLSGQTALARYGIHGLPLSRKERGKMGHPAPG